MRPDAKTRWLNFGSIAGGGPSRPKRYGLTTAGRRHAPRLQSSASRPAQQDGSPRILNRGRPREVRIECGPAAPTMPCVRVRDPRVRQHGNFRLDPFETAGKNNTACPARTGFSCPLNLFARRGSGGNHTPHISASLCDVNNRKVATPIPARFNLWLMGTCAGRVTKSLDTARGPVYSVGGDGGRQTPELGQSAFVRNALNWRWFVALRKICGRNARQAEQPRD